MKRLSLFLAIILAVCTVSSARIIEVPEVQAWGLMMPIAGGSVPSGEAPASFCSGGELFCADFETQDMIDWDNTPASEDCTFDGDGDWGDYCAGAALEDSYGAGIRDDFAYLGEALTSTASEWNLEATFKANDITDTYLFRIMDAAGNTVMAVIYVNASDLLYTDTDASDPVNTGETLLNNTKYHIGVHYIEGSSSNGTFRVWLNTGGNFAAEDIVQDNDGDINTPSVDAGQIRIYNSGTTSTIIYFDNVAVKSGAPSWPTS